MLWILFLQKKTFSQKENINEENCFYSWGKSTSWSLYKELYHLNHCTHFAEWNNLDWLLLAQCCSSFLQCDC